MRTNVDLAQIATLVEGRHANPFDVLGPHEVGSQGKQVVAVRAYLPHSTRAWVVDRAHQPRPMRKIHPSGLYEALCPADTPQAFKRPYLLRVADHRGELTHSHDPYAFPSYFTEFDLHLLSEGRHWQSYNKLGAQLRRVWGIEGVNFAVWAPSADGVSVIGDFNGWDGRRHPMRRLGSSGIWELFIPGLQEGQLYKYRVKRGDFEAEKSDPYGFAAELPPRTASKVVRLQNHTWGDQQWMEQRVERQQLNRPMSVYEVHLGSWRRPDSSTANPDAPQTSGSSAPESEAAQWLNYRDLAHQLVGYCQEMGFTHVELMPVSEHPFTGSWGYQTVGYFAATSRFGSPEDFMYLVDHCHQHGIGVILDWVPAHFPKDLHGLAEFDGTALYEHADPRQGEHPDWGTLIFNYGRNEVRNFLVANALFWLDKFHIDGLRVDAVASMLYLDYSRQPGQWVPNEFGGRENLAAIDLLKQFNTQIHRQFPGVLTIAEESTAWPGVTRPVEVGGLGFDLKWNMGWMNDVRRYMHQDPLHRKHHHDQLTFGLMYAYSENFMLPFSHDEVVHGKGALLDQMPGDPWQKFANLRLLYGYMWSHPGKKLLFMGNEFGQWREWNHDRSLDWHLLEEGGFHCGMQRYVRDLNQLYLREKAMHQVDFAEPGFQWIDCGNRDQSIINYVRRGEDANDYLVVCCNFTPVPRFGYRVGVPEATTYDEILNSDSIYYSGSNLGNGHGLQPENIPWNGQPYSLCLTLPPLATIVLKPQ